MKVYGCVPFKNKHDRKKIQAALIEEFGKVRFWIEGDRQLAYECYAKRDQLFF